MEIKKIKLSIALIGSLVVVLTVVRMLREALLVTGVWTAAVVLAVCVALWIWDIPSLLLGRNAFVKKSLELLTILIMLVAVLRIWILGIWALEGQELVRWMVMVICELGITIFARDMFADEEGDSLPMLRPALMMFGMLLSLPLAIYFDFPQQQGSPMASFNLVGIAIFGAIYIKYFIPEIHYEASTLREEVRRFWLG